MFPPLDIPQSLFIALFFRISIRNLSFSRRRERNGRKTDGCESIDQHHAYAYRLSLPFLVFRLSLSLSLSLLPFSSQETSTSPFSFPIGGNGLRFFNGVPLVWWEICFKPVVVSLACSANLSKFEGFVENSLLSEGCCTNFYLSANFEELTLMDPFFPSDQVEGRFD